MAKYKVQTYIDKEIYDALKVLSGQEQCSISGLVHLSIIKYLGINQTNVPAHVAHDILNRLENLESIVNSLTSHDASHDSLTSHDVSHDSLTSHDVSHDSFTSHNASHDSLTSHNASHDSFTSHNASHDSSTICRVTGKVFPPSTLMDLYGIFLIENSGISKFWDGSKFVDNPEKIKLLRRLPTEKTIEKVKQKNILLSENVRFNSLERLLISMGYPHLWKRYDTVKTAECWMDRNAIKE